ncbi:hypothetical protein CHUAL_007591 [Chamberlinius hualienensis]
MRLKMLKSITVEPALLIFMIGSYMEYGVYQDLLYKKLCLEHYDYSNFICDDPQDEALDYVQTQGAYWLAYNNIALLVPSILAACYLGAWGDRYGRKIPILAAVVSTMFGYLIFLIISVYENSSVYYILLANFVAGLGGGYLMIVASMMSYVADISSTNSRTTRVGILESMTTFGSFFGPFISGYLLEGVGYAYTFLFCVSCNTVVAIYLVIRLKNISPASKIKKRPVTERRENDTIDIFNSTSYSSSEVLTERKRPEAMCRLGYIYEGFLVCFSKREGKTRLYIVSLMTACLCVFMASNAESNLTYLYAKDKPLNWTYKTYSQYCSLKNALSASMLLIGLPLLRKYFHLKDTSLAAIGLLSRAAGLILLSLSTTLPMMFIVPELALFGMYPIPSMRSMLSKLVKPTEQGKMFSALATVESLTEIVATIMYNNLYPVTRSFFNGFCFILAVVFLVPSLCIICWLHWENWKNSKRQTIHVVNRDESAQDQTID